MGIDTASEGVRYTRERAEAEGVAHRVRAEQGSALEVEHLRPDGFDLIVGSFILHHVEPFEVFAEVLRRTLRPGGRGVFIENNASNPLLMFARRHLAGRFGIPRYGDDEEHPLEAKEIDLLREHFAYVEQQYPDFVFFRKLNTYVLRGKVGWAGRVLHAFDRVAYRIPRVRSYSYKQVVELRGPKSPSALAQEAASSRDKKAA